YQRGAEAYRVLMDPEARSRYDAGLSQGRLRDTGQSVGPAPAAKPSVRPASLPAARAAQRAMQEGDLPTAKARLLEALSHDPRNVVLLRGLQEIEERMARGE
ncbi:MAG: hypothetical protein KC416_17600, partial [Myxococcales bacterium]|nr:hypothetical protein [Myxococcales bacterium]